MKHSALLASLALIALIALVACSSTTAPRSATLFVENTTCASTCSTLDVLAFPTNQPNTPGGMWSIPIGTLSAPTGCFALPPSASFRVSSNGVIESTYSWTLRDAVAIGTSAGALDRMAAVPSTTAFVPATARGWRVRLPGGTAVAVADPCTP